MTSRRSSLGLLSAAPAAAREIASQVASGALTKAAQSATMAEYGMSAGAPVVMGMGHSGSFGMQIVGLIQAGLAPDWMKRQWQMQARGSSHSIPDDIVSLRSVSMSAKRRMAIDQYIAKIEQATIDEIVSQAARDRFFGGGDDSTHPSVIRWR